MDTADQLHQPSIDAPAADQHDAGRSLMADIDRVSLEQALVDFEMANARVIDLNQRLVEANEAARRHRRSADDAIAALDEARAHTAAAVEATAGARAEAEQLAAQLAVARDELEAARGAERDAIEQRRKAEATIRAIEATRSYRAGRAAARFVGQIPLLGRLVVRR